MRILSYAIFSVIFTAATGAFGFNNPPVPANDHYTTDWDTDLFVDAPGLLGNDLDPDGDFLETHLLTGPSSGHLILGRDGSFSYEPVAGVAGSFSFEYKAWDGLVFTVATATIQVTSGNQAPTANDDLYSHSGEDRLVVDAPGVLQNDSDPEGATLVSHLIQNPEFGILGFHQDGSFWYEPEPGFSGEVTFVYKVTDGTADDEATVRIVVLDDVDSCATAAMTDQYARFNGGHAFWMPKIGKNFVFADGGTFVEKANGTAKLTGIIHKRNKPRHAFKVKIHFRRYRENPPNNGSPKKELIPTAYVEQGGPVDTDTWYYYKNFQGTLKGIKRYKGAVIDIHRTGPAFQIGEGASGKNINFGGSGWFKWKVLRHGDNFQFSKNKGHGDINIDIDDSCP